jgi:hypothetical protein
MFVRVRLARRARLRRLYGLFVLFQFHDYGHLRGPLALMRWLRGIWRELFPPRLSPSPAGGAPQPALAGDGADIRSPR